MTGAELIKLILENKAEDKEILLGCEGYISEEDTESNGIKAEAIKGTNLFFIHDSCYYEEAR